ncbi:MAG: SDR family NAD(P)-dependent oxidoreductase [Alphaproteobacteria bacterium]|nr:SDR family NAD(P)-dependent oxidoreductase [Alphaproteobacteria bacterium]MBU0794006.1 SDR family NAD(P)-dependent oxidoreductase [Alphaproteobacteria bacterium]MBU0874514.1 SDR family NAD(P)-dependent oxidoreductase [Alphaproteobacteria bacterium]MBU1769827.1 SDR family NAD(P)-dependent oxidoreductase [Alphaproteobacteria bacterium]
MDIAGTTAFITGGASGIGFGIAQQLLANGARLVLADIRQDHLDEAKAFFEERQQGRNVHTIRLDVSDRDQMREAAKECEAVMGGPDILVNNAGIDPSGPFDQATYADWDYGIGVNLMGPINGIMEFAPGMRRRGRGGHIVNTASLAGLTPMPSFMAIYAVAKAGVITLSESIRDSMAEDNIGVTVLMPGPIKSRIHESGQNRPERFRGNSGFAETEQQLAKRVVSDTWMEPTEVGDMIVDAIRNNTLYVSTHGNWKETVEERFKALIASMPEAKPFDFGATLAVPQEES